MPDSLAEFLTTRQPTAERPLLGHTVLLVEDSRFASEAVRLLCLRSGARIRRADSLHAADRHLRSYRPSVVIVDLGLPDGSGLDLIEDLDRAVPRVEVLLATSGDTALADAAVAAGADGFLAKPITSLGLFQDAVLSGLPVEARPRGPRAVSSDRVTPDPLALRDDLEHILDLLRGTPDAAMLDYAARFLTGIARASDDVALERAAQALVTGQTSRAGLATVTQLVTDRIKDRAVV